MTVILGVRCKDGLIIAADSQGTMHDPGNVPVRVDSIKLQKLGNSAILGSSGAQGLTQRVIDGLSGQPHAFSLKRKRADAVKELTKVSNQIQKAAVSEWSGYPDTKPDAWGCICCGWADDGGWMYEVAFQGGGQYHDEYCSTGSGHPFAFLAMASVKHYNVNSLNLTQAKALAYRVIDTICSTAGFGVSGPVQMGVVTSEGATILDTPELEAIKDSVNLWKGQEKEAIGALAGTDADSAPAAGQEIDHLVEGLDPPEAS